MDDVPQHVDLILVVAGNPDGLLSRTLVGVHQEAVPRTGALWLSPAGVGRHVALTAPIPRTLHMYLPIALFDRLKGDFNLPMAPAHSIRDAAGIRDSVINEVGRSILSELTVETSASRLYVETASMMLAARLIQKYCDSGTCTPSEYSVRAMDKIRLRRIRNLWIRDVIHASYDGANSRGRSQTETRTPPRHRVASSRSQIMSS